MIRSIVLALCVSAHLSGCLWVPVTLTVPMASPDDDVHAKTFAIRPNKANIYLYRNQFTGQRSPIAVALNGKFAGETAMRTYFMWEVDPGSHEITSQAENVETLKINVEPGRITSYGKN